MNLSPEEIGRQFEIPNDVAYLNVAGVGPLAKGTLAAGEVGLHIKAQPWRMGEFEFFDQVDLARERFARLIGAMAQDIAIIPSATYGIESALLNAQLGPGDHILIQAEEFPSIVLPSKRWCDRTGAHLKVVQRPPDFDWTLAVLEAINEATRVVVVGPCHWIDGSLLDLAQIGEKASQVGALFIVDACQAAGAYPLDVRSFQPDFLVAPTYKWLLGPYSYGFLYVAPPHHEGETLEQYWASRKGARDFTQLTQLPQEYGGGAIRYDMGGRSQFINTPMAIAALDQILEWRPDRIAQKIQVLVDQIAEEASRRGWQVPPLDFRAPHFIGIRRAQGYSKALQEALIEKKIFVSFRGDCLRIAPHLYNRPEHIDRLFGVLSEID